MMLIFKCIIFDFDLIFLVSPPSCVQEAEVGNSSVPEPFDVRTEHAEEARALNFDEATEVGAELGVSNGD